MYTWFFLEETHAYENLSQTVDVLWNVRRTKHGQRGSILNAYGKLVENLKIP